MVCINTSRPSRLDKAGGMYQYIADHWEGKEDMLWARSGFAKVDIARENDACAEEKIEAFVVDFNDNPALAEAVFSVAKGYWDKSHSKRNELLIEQQHKYLRKALGTWKRIKNLPNSQSVLADSYYYCGDCYRLLDERNNAIEMYDEVVKQWPHFKYAASAQFGIAQSYEHLWLISGGSDSDSLEKAKAAYRRIVENYPNSHPARIAAGWLKNNDR